MKFSIRDLFLVTVIVAVCVAWWLDRSRLATDGARDRESLLKLRRIGLDVGKMLNRPELNSEFSP